MIICTRMHLEGLFAVLRYSALEIGFTNRVTSVISVLQRETTLINPDSTGEPVSMESKIVRVVSLSTTEISEITRLKIRSAGSKYLKFVPVGKVYNPFPNKPWFLRV